MSTDRVFKDELAGVALVLAGIALPFVAATAGTFLFGRPLVGLITLTLVCLIVMIGVLGVCARLPIDVNAGLFMISVAALGLWLGWAYPFGTPGKMGAGFVPKVLCWMLGGIGAVVVVIGLVSRDLASEGVAWRPLLATLSSVIVFALLIEPIPWAEWLPTGLVPASIASLLVAGLGTSETRWLELIVFTVVLSLLSVLLFVRALGLAMRSGIGI